MAGHDEHRIDLLVVENPPIVRDSLLGAELSSGMFGRSAVEVGDVSKLRFGLGQCR